MELRVLVWHVYRPKRPTETRQKRQEGETGKQQTKTTTAKNQRRTCKHTHINTWILHKNRVKEIKKKTGKKQNNRQALYQPTGKRKAKEGEQTKRKMVNQHSANQSKKKCNENSDTNCTHKNATDKEKTQGKKQTTGKNYFERKINFAQTLKARKGPRTAKQYSEVNLGIPNTLPTNRKKSFGFNFKKKMNQSIFLKKNSENCYWSRKSEQLCWCLFIGPLKNTWTNEGLANCVHNLREL